MTCFEGMLTDGPSAGVKFIQVENGGGLSARILPGRGLDLYQVRFAGQNMNYLSPAGARSARLYDGREDHFLRNFYVGQLTTGGLQNLGPERRVYGEMQGLHGRFDNTEASGVFCRRFVTEDRGRIDDFRRRLYGSGFAALGQHNMLHTGFRLRFDPINH